MQRSATLVRLALVVGATCLVTAPAHAQERSRHTDTWTFGNHCRMHWNADATSITLSYDANVTAGEGCTSFSDPQTGDLLLYSDGVRVWNGAGVKVHDNMPGDASSMHAAVIIPVPGSPGTAYVLAHNSTQSSSIAYARFDLANAGALIAGSTGTIALDASAGREGMLVIPHANGVDYWLLVSGLSKIYVFHVSASGISAPTSIDSGLSIWTNGWSIFTMSHQNDRLAMSGNSGGDIALWDFDNSTGGLSNRTVINNPRPSGIENREYYGGVFSPDGTKLYYAVLTGNDNLGHFYQYDRETGVHTQVAVGSSRYYFGDGRLGPDGKIYVAGSTGNTGVHVIDNPNAAGTDCGFRKDAISESNAAWAGCAVQLGLPQIPSPLVAVNLQLAVTVLEPSTPVTTSSVTPSGSANAPNGSTVVVTVTGPDGTLQTCQATVTNATWSCPTDAITGLGVGPYAVTAIVSSGSVSAEDDASFCSIVGLPAGSAPEVCVEVCASRIDDDLNGYVDVYDPACQPPVASCSVPVTPAAFTIQLKNRTDTGFEDLFWPITADVDGDGKTEILASNNATGTIQVLDGDTLALESSIPVDGDRGDVFAVANLDADPQLEVATIIHTRVGGALANRMMIADWVGDHWVVDMSAASENTFSCAGNVGTGLGIGFADFDGDGRAEVFYGNEIWTYPADLSTGCTDCVVKAMDADRDVASTAMHGCRVGGNGAGPQGAVSIVADVLSAGDCNGDHECDGPELVVAGQVYSVDMANKHLTLRRDVNTFGAGTTFGDGFTAVADLDNDGDLDVAVAGDAPGGNQYAYDPRNKKVLRVWNLTGNSGHGYGPITIADVYDEDLADDGNTNNDSVGNVPELISARLITGGGYIYAVNVGSATPVWSLATTDTSGSTSTTVFDFNGDGILEMAFRDEQQMRVMYGGPMAYAPAGVDPSTRNYAAFPCLSATMNEGPAVADLDDDGAAELAVVCLDSKTNAASARLTIFESATTPWRQARRVWNQPMFAPGAIDEAGKVYPVAQERGSYIPEGTRLRPLNVNIAQNSPLDYRPREANRLPAMDVAVVSARYVGPDGCEATRRWADVTLANEGSAAVPTSTTIGFYTANGEGGFVVKTLGDAAQVLEGALPLEPGQTATLRFDLDGLRTGALTVVVNRSANLGGSADGCNPGPGQAAFFDGYGFTGACIVLDIGVYNYLASAGSPVGFGDVMFNDTLSSVKVGTGTTVTLYQHWAQGYDGSAYIGPDYTDSTGITRTLTADQADLRNIGIDNTVSSVIITGPSNAIPECDTTDNQANGLGCVPLCFADEAMPNSGCDLDAPYCAVVAGVSTCTSCVDDTPGGVDTGCNTEAPACDPVTRTCVACADDPACSAPGFCAASELPDMTFEVNAACEVARDPGYVDPVVEWHVGSFTASPSYNQVMMQPVAGNLTDDNGDGLIDERDTPDIAFTTFAGSSYANVGVLRVISGDDGHEIFATATSDNVFGSSGVAVGDLDGNGRPELVVGLSGTATVGVWEANPPGASPAFVKKWTSSACTLGAYPYMNPAIANVDGAGAAEIIVPGPCVLRADGSLLAVASASRLNDNAPFAADVDDDAALEIIGGSIVYDLPTEGTALVTKYSIGSGTSYDFAAVGDVDGDGEAEIVVVDTGAATLTMFDPNGEIDADSIDTWTTTIDTDGDGPRGGPPTLADFDGDGQIEIGVAAEYNYSVIDTDGTILWQQTVIDNSSRVTGSSVFDFDGDGAAEVVYADQENAFVYDGATGAVRAQLTDHASGTLFEYPIVVDVDHDGQAEIVLASNNYGGRTGWTGITVIGSETSSWSPARPVWNQHAYSISNVNDDLSIPAVAVKNWTRWNNFRAGAAVEGLANWRSDLFIAAADACESGCTEVPLIGYSVVVGNRGKLDVSLATVTARAGSVEGPVVGESEPVAVGSGGSGVAFVEVPASAFAEGGVVFVVESLDANGECDYSNNWATLAWGSVFTDVDSDEVADVCDSCIATGAELCDGIDNDCNGTVDDGCDDDHDGYCDATLACNAQVALEVCPKGCGDCDDANASASPAGTEVCNGKDDDCDGTKDDVAPRASVCGVGACVREGTITCSLGVEHDSCVPGTPAANDAVCNGIDDDCKDGTDEDYVRLPVSCDICNAAPRTSCVGGHVVVPACQPIENGTPCDGNACALASACTDGQCLPTRVKSCDDGNPCTADYCDPAVGCRASVVEDGASCDDDNACTSGETCKAGLCVGQGEACDAPKECERYGVCNPATGVCDYDFVEGCLACGSDITAPTLVCPAPVEKAECSVGGTDVGLGAPSARDACSAVTVRTDAPNVFEPGTTTVTFEAIDAAGNRATCATSVEVVDTAAPALNCPEVTDVEGDPGTCGAIVTLPMTAQDACDGTAVTLIGPAVEGAFFPPGETPTFVAAVDAAGNQAVCNTIINVTGLDGFSIRCEDTVTVEAPADFCGWPEALTAQVIDECRTAVDVESKTEAFPIGDTDVVFDASRADGATATCTTKLTVEDVTPPAIDCGAPTAPIDLRASFIPEVKDACTATVTLSDLGCERETDGVAAAVTERCDVSVQDGGTAVRVDDAPAPEDGQVYVVWKVTAVDPSGNESHLDCRAPVDPESLDHDGDGIADRDDNCPATKNPDQLDTNMNGIGDACEPVLYDGLEALGGAGCGAGDASLGLVGLALAGLVLVRRRAAAR